MVEAEFDGFSVSAEDTSGVTGIGDIEIFSLNEKGNISGASSVGVLIPGRGVFAIGSGFDSLELLFAFFGVKEFVHLEESRLETFFVVFLQEIGIISEFLDEMSGDEFSNFLS